MATRTTGPVTNPLPKKATHTARPSRRRPAPPRVRRPTTRLTQGRYFASGSTEAFEADPPTCSKLHPGVMGPQPADADLPVSRCPGYPRHPLSQSQPDLQGFTEVGSGLFGCPLRLRPSPSRTRSLPFSLQLLLAPVTESEALPSWTWHLPQSTRILARPALVARAPSTNSRQAPLMSFIVPSAHTFPLRKPT